MKIDYDYVRFVRDFQPVLLSRPRRKSSIEDKTERLEELEIVSVDVGLWSSSI